MSFFRSAVLISALYRVVRGENSGSDLDASAVFHVTPDFGKRIAYNDIIPNDLFSKELETYVRQYGNDTQSTTDPFDAKEPWSILWYFASFSGLIVFFLVVSCSEWCCRKHIRRNNSSQQTSPPSPTPSSGGGMPEAPPPAYDLFAPPSYESLTSQNNNKEKSEYDVYVVPVHAIATVLGAGASEVPEDAPPSYSAINMNFVPDRNSLEDHPRNATFNQSETYSLPIDSTQYNTTFVNAPNASVSERFENFLPAQNVEVTIIPTTNAILEARTT